MLEATSASNNLRLDVSALASSPIRGAEILIRALITNSVDTIFGLPGGAVLHIYDELWRYRDSITYYFVRHEQGGIHAAEGYARATGKVGVALVTSGPGAKNFVTGIATDYIDPILMGITRDAALRIASELGFELTIKPLELDDPLCADEDFFTCTAAEIAPIREVDGRAIGDGTRGPVTERIQSGFFDVVYGRNQRFSNWLHQVRSAVAAI